MATTSKKGLGKGLEAIFIENDSEDKNSTILLKLSEIEPNRGQPRHEFKEEALMELADSIAKHGLIQPLLVRPVFGGGYQIVAGERRWRACRMAGLSEIPVVVREIGDSEVMELALIENLQREDLSVIEEALGYKRLMDEYKLTQEEVSKTVGKSRPVITNALRLLKLPQNILDLLSNGTITAGHARALLAFENVDDMQKVLQMVLKQNLTVRDIENLVKRFSQSKTKDIRKKKRDVFFDEVEISLNERLSRKIKVNQNKGERGILQIEFFNKEDLSDLAKLLGE